MASRSSPAADLAISATLSSYYVENFVSPEQVMRILREGQIRFMLVGLHGLLTWLDEPRATQDVDVLVGPKHQKKAVRILLQHFPNLFAQEHEVVTRLLDKATERVLIDVMKTNQPLFREGFKYSHQVKTSGDAYLVPSLELALAMKFAPMVSLTRSDEKKHLDAHDFIRMVRMNSIIDLEKLAQLGELVYPGGGAEIVQKVRQVRAGEKLQL